MKPSDTPLLSSANISLQSQPTPQSSLGLDEQVSDQGELPSFDVEPLPDDDALSQNGDLNSGVLIPNTVASIHEEEVLELSGIQEQSSSVIQDSIHVSDTAMEQPEDNHSEESREKNVDDSEDSDYVNHRGSLHVVNGTQHYGYKTKVVRKSILKRVDAMNGFPSDTVSGKDKSLLNLRNVGVQKRKEYRKKPNSTKRQRTNKT